MKPVIIGAGLAGLITALKLAPMPVTVLSPYKLGIDCASSWAQGGLSAAVGDDDSAELHATDTLSAGAGACDPAVVAAVTQDGPDIIRYLALLAFRSIKIMTENCVLASRQLIAAAASCMRPTILAMPSCKRSETRYLQHLRLTSSTMLRHSAFKQLTAKSAASLPTSMDNNTSWRRTASCLRPAALARFGKRRAIHLAHGVGAWLLQREQAQNSPISSLCNSTRPLSILYRPDAPRQRSLTRRRMHFDR